MDDAGEQKEGDMPLERKRYSFVVPLNASGIDGFKPDLTLNVMVKDRREKLCLKPVKLEQTGKGQAKFEFSSHPGLLLVIIGPGDAGDDELLGSQSHSLEVTKVKRGRMREWVLKPVRIKPSCWWRWHRRCRLLTICRRVECQDGNPVPGAKVCACDVDPNVA